MKQEMEQQQWKTHQLNSISELFRSYGTYLLCLAHCLVPCLWEPERVQLSDTYLLLGTLFLSYGFYTHCSQLVVWDPVFGMWFLFAFFSAGYFDVAVMAVDVQHQISSD